MKLLIGSAAIVLAITAPGLPQGPSSPARPPAQSVKLQVVLTRSEGDKKISSPYSVFGSSSGENASLRIGAEVPGSAPGSTAQQVGMQLDYSVTGAIDGSFSVKLGLNAHFLAPDGLRAIISSNTVTLRDGESTKITGNDDKGGAFTVDVTLTLVK